MKALFPPLWHTGARLGLCNPSSPADQPRLERGVAWLQHRGFELVLAPSTQTRAGIHAGSAEERARELNGFLRDPDIDGILCVRGGTGTLGLLERIDYEAARTHPKLLVGFSDPTALLLALHARTGLVSIAGQMVVQLFDATNEYTEDRWWDFVRGPWPIGPLPLPQGHELEVLHPGTAEGTLFPVNFSLFNAIIGTPFLPDLTGAILLLEEIDERPESLDRMVDRLRLSGVAERLGGIVLGQFTHCLPRNDKLIEADGLRLVWNLASSLGIPALAHFPHGHEAICCSLPLGAPARLTTDPPGLEILAPAV
ncbi:MAG: LD-carboxypeptidase [Candidatus Eisenbacteria bacterium]|uniref:LD-carboxypeptidase n=1 Tax=Eiseniibacteriota bacterium TaxID=2212470 RepID=A0A956LZG0_UNCEI|nr:LD-carboxypeptidase [Candidatus Eisenbacteria bacterium]